MKKKEIVLQKMKYFWLLIPWLVVQFCIFLKQKFELKYVFEFGTYVLWGYFDIFLHSKQLSSTKQLKWEILKSSMFCVNLLKSNHIKRFRRKYILFWWFLFESKAESFYYIKHGSSIITSKILSKILSNENKKTGVFGKIVCFGITIHMVLSWRQQKHQCFHYWDFLTNFWCNNWWSIFDVVERLCFRDASNSVHK